MKITNVRLTPVNIPLESCRSLWTAGFYPGTDKALIEVENGRGHRWAWAKRPWIRSWPGTWQRSRRRRIGQDLFDIAGIESLCVPAWQIVQNTDGSADMTVFGGLESRCGTFVAKPGTSPSTSFSAALCARTSRSPSTSAIA